jgi:hypothetical protein
MEEYEGWTAEGFFFFFFFMPSRLKYNISSLAKTKIL